MSDETIRAAAHLTSTYFVWAMIFGALYIVTLFMDHAIYLIDDELYRSFYLTCALVILGMILIAGIVGVADMQKLLNRF